MDGPPDGGSGAAGIATQTYRYVRTSDPLKRQQTKWVVLGVTGAILTGIVFAVARPQVPTIGYPETDDDLVSVTADTLASRFIPLTLGLAIPCYRLWDIDLVVNRTLVYGTLTAGLVGRYLLVVSGLGALVPRGRLPILLLAAALVAVLVAPLRD